MDSVDTVRKGKWSAEEENYANKIILFFNQGKLRIAPGTTLRAYLSEKLRCDPMRITKKYAGSASIGKQLFMPCESAFVTEHSLAAIEAELQELERKFLLKTMAKKTSSRAPAQTHTQTQAQTHTQAHTHTTPSRPVLSSSGASDGGSEGGGSERFDGKSSPNGVSGNELSETESAASHTHTHTHTAPSHKVITLPFQRDALKKLSLQKRVYSAPNLTVLSSDGSGRHALFSSGEGTQSGKYGQSADYESLSGKRAAAIPEQTKTSRFSQSNNNNQDKAELVMRFAGLPAIGEEFDLDTFNAIHANTHVRADGNAVRRRERGWKRARSSMALMDLEKLVADDEAAGALFVEFINNLKSMPSSSSLARTLSPPADSDCEHVVKHAHIGGSSSHNSLDTHTNVETTLPRSVSFSLNTQQCQPPQTHNEREESEGEDDMLVDQAHYRSQSPSGKSHGDGEEDDEDEGNFF